MSPERQQFESKFKRYRDVKERSGSEIKEVPKKWNKFDYLSDSPHKKGHRVKFPEHLSIFGKRLTLLVGFVEKKPKVTKITPTIEKGKVQPAHEETLLPLKPKEKEVFMALRDFYNSLDNVSFNRVNFIGPHQLCKRSTDLR